MYINTRFPIDAIPVRTEKEFKKYKHLLQYSLHIGEKDSKELGEIRKSLFRSISRYEDIDKWVRLFDEQKEKEFFVKHGMGSQEWKKEERQKQFKQTR